MENGSEDREPRSRVVFSNKNRQETAPQGGLKRSANLFGEGGSSDQDRTRKLLQDETYLERFRPEETVSAQFEPPESPRMPRFDPQTGRPLRSQYREEDLPREAPQAAPETPRVPRFDPQTGEPLYPNAPAEELFSEEPAPAEEAPRVPRFDPETGAPLYPQEQAPRSEDPALLDDFRRDGQKQTNGNRLFVILMIVLSAILLAGVGVLLYFAFSGRLRPADAEPVSTPAVSDGQSEQQSRIVDTWRVVKIKKDGKISLPEDVGFAGTFEFRSDGTVRITKNGAESTERYTVSGNTITVTSGSGAGVSGSYDPAEDTVFFNDPNEGYSLWCAREKANASEAPQEGEATPSPSPEIVFPFPTDGVPDETLQAAAAAMVAADSVGYTLNGVTHSIDANKLTDRVSLTLDDKRADDTYRSAVELLYRFDPKTGTWDLIDRNQTTPESFAHLFPTPVPDKFMFGGVSIDRGATEIDGELLGINGTKNYFVRITKNEVETLVKLCPDLKTLKLQYCYMDTYEPLSRLTELEWLELRYCGTDDGGVPITNIDWIAPLTNLKRLSLNHNEITDVKALEDLTGLWLLNLGENLLDDDAMPIIGKLVNLTDLNLYKNPISDFDQLTELKQVRYLNFHHTNVKSIDFLKKLPSLNRIFIGLDYNGKTLPKLDWYKVLKECKSLKEVTVKSKEEDIINALYDLWYEGYITKYDLNNA